MNSYSYQKIFILCFLVIQVTFIGGNSTNAQLKVDAGNDVIVCSGDEYENVQLGGSPVASGGVEPYVYTWSGKHFDFKYPTGIPSWIYASDILDDTTKSNPVIKEWRNVPDEWTTYYLKVEDAEGTIMYDSVLVKRSVFIIGGPYKIPVSIHKGDSVQFFGNISILFSNFEPLTEFLFSPTHGLSDPTDIFGWAKPDKSITYYLEAVNSAGCRSGKIEYWHIEVIDTTTNQQTILVQEGKLWSNVSIGSMSGNEYRSYWIKFEGDTIINDLEYKKVLQADDSIHSDWYINGFIREEVANQKVYLYDKYRDENMLLYDFSLETGDSILTGDGVFFAKVDSVIYEPFGNSTDTLKQIYFDSGGVWIEGIGSLWGVLEGLNAFYMVGATLKLVCYYENDFLVYHNPDFETCFPDITTVSVSMFGNKKEIEIFPNPASDKITIYSQSSRILEVKIYDLTGTCLYQKFYTETNRIDLNTDYFPKGMYVLKVKDERDTISSKIVIQ